MARIRTAVMVACVTLLCTSAGAAQVKGNRLNERYSQGLHAYYAGEWEAAHSAFSEVIKAGFQNPCCYYFRGMVSYQQGDKQSAQQDFQAGAAREANAIRQKFPISKALERVQGGARVMIERARLQARLAVVQKRLTREKQRYEALVRNEAKVVRKAAPGSGAAEPAIEITDKAANDPFADGGAGLTGSAVAADATAKPAAVGTGVIPRGNQEPAPAVAPKKEEVNPFGEDPADDADAARPAPATEPEEANPFGEPADDADAAKLPTPAPAAERSSGGRGWSRLKESDADGDGKISKDEAPDNIKRFFDRLDKNGDGFIEEGELSSTGGGGNRPAPAAPAAAPEKEEANPFGEPADDADAAKPAPATEPEEANPFGEPADGPDATAKPAPREQPAAAASGGNPLGAVLRAFSKAAGVEGLVPSAEQLESELEELLPLNPFGGGESDVEADAAAESPARPVENPFAEPAAQKPAAQKPAAQKPAAEPSNPFDTPEKEAAAPAKPAPAAKPQAPAEENPFD